MRIAVIGEPDCQNSDFRTSAARAGFDLWFLDRQVVEMASRIEALDALAIFTDAVSAQEQETARAMAQANCIPTYCASCAGAALCGRTDRTNIN
jgi:hypothetical protein